MGEVKTDFGQSNVAFGGQKQPDNTARMLLETRSGAFQIPTGKPHTPEERVFCAITKRSAESGIPLYQLRGRVNFSVDSSSEGGSARRVFRASARDDPHGQFELTE
jgi:hypothetical protein